MILSYAICNVPHTALRAEPSHRSEQVSELLFGEHFEVYQKQDNGWWFIRCSWDGYEGWVYEGYCTEISFKQFNQAAKYIAGIDSNIKLNSGLLLKIPPGANLFGLKGKQLNWLPYSGTFKGTKLLVNDLIVNSELLTKVALSYTGTPYVWGGRSNEGIDCSGLSQIVYKFMGISLPRDASQQVQKGTEVGFLQEAQCGDLAFFDNAEGRINHVGILLDNSTIIHSTEFAGSVVIDKIDNGGIINQFRRKRSHTLRIIKRYFES